MRVAAVLTLFSAVTVPIVALSCAYDWTLGPGQGPGAGPSGSGTTPIGSAGDVDDPILLGTDGVCPEGKACRCDDGAKCGANCPMGGCRFSCGAGVCDFQCTGGACTLACASAAVTCDLACTGTSCAQDCRDQAICTVSAAQ